MAPADDFISISSTDAAKLNVMAVGDHTYLEINDARGVELVRYDHTAPIIVSPGTMIITVSRAQGGTARRAWPIHGCLKTSLDHVVLAEFICQTAGACA
jgi:hypothetical protein